MEVNGSSRVKQISRILPVCVDMAARRKEARVNGHGPKVRKVKTIPRECSVATYEES